MKARAVTDNQFPILYLIIPLNFLLPIVMSPSPAAQQLYLDAFPRYERRDLDAWVAMADTDGLFCIEERQWQGQFAGFLTYWTFPGFTYVEHFATAPALRGHGLGGKWLDDFVALTPQPVVLEVEPNDTPMARRRIAFYERHGFHLSEVPYVQPAYRREDQPCPLYLMTTDHQYLSAHADAVIRQIHTAVYGVGSR